MYRFSAVNAYRRESLKLSEELAFRVITYNGLDVKRHITVLGQVRDVPRGAADLDKAALIDVSKRRCVQ